MFKLFNWKTAIFSAAAAALLAASGCGGGGSADAGSLTKAQLIKRGDAICEKDFEIRGNESIPYAEKGPNAFSTAEKEKLVLKIVVPTYRHDVEGLEALVAHGAPQGDEEKVEKIVDAFNATLKRIEEKPGSILKGAAAQFSEVEGLTLAYGFKVCGRA